MSWIKEHIEKRKNADGVLTIFTNASFYERIIHSQLYDALCTVDVNGKPREGRIKGNFKFVGWQKFWPLGANFEVDIYGLASGKIKRFNMFEDNVVIHQPDKQDDLAWTVTNEERKT